jgi:hypothetical protein
MSNDNNETGQDVSRPKTNAYTIYLARELAEYLPLSLHDLLNQFGAVQFLTMCRLHDRPLGDLGGRDLVGFAVDHGVDLRQVVEWNAKLIVETYAPDGVLPDGMILSNIACLDARDFCERE